MTNTIPKISVLMPAYNAGSYIREAINSVLQQSFSDFEFIIINDGSTDDTEQIIKSCPDQRIRLFQQENQGVAAALNLGLAKARGKWVARFDADDICYLNRLSVQYAFVQEHSDQIIVGSAGDYIDMHGNYIFTYRPPACSPEAIRQIKNRQCPFIHSSVLYLRQAILEAGGYDLNSHGFEDHFLWTKVLRHGKGSNLAEPLIRVRLNPESFTIDERWRPQKFRSLKSKVLHTGSIDSIEGRMIQKMLQKQGSFQLKEAAYYALLGKKYLWNNYQPDLARRNLEKSWNIRPRSTVFLLWMLSCLPQRLIDTLYQLRKRRSFFYRKTQQI